MARLMSVRYTEEQVRARIKDVTRRLGWTNLPEGSELDLCRQVMGRRKGQPLVRIARVRAVSVRRERLDVLVTDLDYGHAEMVREGFPGMHPMDFITTYFIDAQNVSTDTEVTRIEWTYVE